MWPLIVLNYFYNHIMFRRFTKTFRSIDKFISRSAVPYNQQKFWNYRTTWLTAHTFSPSRTLLLLKNLRVRLVADQERVMRTMLLFIYNQVFVKATQPECTPTLMIAMASLCVTWLEMHMKWPVPRDLNLTRQYSSVIGQTTSSVRMAVESRRDTKGLSGRLCKLL